MDRVNNNEMQAKLALPTPQQVQWQDMEMGMFIHWAPNVYQELQYDSLSTPLSQINPHLLDTEQWAQVAEELGAGYIVVVAKHVGGFCLWQTETTEYGVRNTPWRNGKGDVIKDLSESCRKRGIKLGVYISPRDDYLGASTGGVCATPEEQGLYDAIYRQQLTELLTRYGEMVEVWFDGSSDCDVGDILARYAPNAMVFQSKYATIRWVGNEEGVAAYPAWNSVPESEGRSGVATNRNSTPEGELWMPLECDTTIRADWFWSTANHTTLKSLDQLMELYYRSVGNGAVLLLNANPDRTGLIPAEDQKRAREFGGEIRRRFGRALAQTSGTGECVELDLGSLTKIDHVEIMEDIAKGERVRRFLVEGWNGEEWIALFGGTAIGHKHLKRLETAVVSKVRFTSLKSVGDPVIRKLAVYYTGIRYEASGEGQANSVKVAEWGRANFWQQGETISMDHDLTDVIDAVDQYEIEYADNAGPTEILAFSLSLDGREYPRYITKTGEGKLVLYLPGVGQKIQVTVTLKPSAGASGGYVLLKRLNG